MTDLKTLQDEEWKTLFPSCDELERLNKQFLKNPFERMVPAHKIVSTGTGTRDVPLAVASWFLSSDAYSIDLSKTQGANKKEMKKPKDNDVQKTSVVNLKGSTDIVDKKGSTDIVNKKGSTGIVDKKDVKNKDNGKKIQKGNEKENAKRKRKRHVSDDSDTESALSSSDSDS